VNWPAPASDAASGLPINGNAGHGLADTGFKQAQDGYTLQDMRL